MPKFYLSSTDTLHTADCAHHFGYVKVIRSALPPKKKGITNCHWCIRRFIPKPTCQVCYEFLDEEGICRSCLYLND